MARMQPVSVTPAVVCSLEWWLPTTAITVRRFFNHTEREKMNRKRVAPYGGLLVLIAAAGVAHAETSVTVTKMHLCCDHCVRDVTTAVTKVKGASLRVNRAENSVTVTGADDAIVQKALDSMAAAGFHGATGNAKLAIKDDSGVKAGKVKRLELVGIHNCCRGCNRAVKKAIASVEGVASDSAKAKETTLTVEGDFDGQAVVRALFKAGFHVKARAKSTSRKP